MAAEQIVQVSSNCVLLTQLSVPTGSEDRFVSLGHELIRTRGHRQVLREYNHVAWGPSGRMPADLRTAFARGVSDQVIPHAFQVQHASTALAVPVFWRFNTTAWAVPSTAPLMGDLMAMQIIRRWHGAKKAVIAAEAPEFLERWKEVRRETGV